MFKYLILHIKAIFLFVKYFRPSTNSKRVVVSLTQHLGDIVACEPVSRYAIGLYKDVCIYWVVMESYAPIIEKNPNIDRIVPVKNLSEWIFLKKNLEFFAPDTHLIDLHFKGQVCQKYGYKLLGINRNNVALNNYFYLGNLLESFCLASGIERLLDKPNLYIIDSDKPDLLIPNNFIVIHTKSNDASKDWPPEKWELFILEIIRKYKLYVIEVGLKSELQIKDKHYINYCGQLQIRGIAFVISKARYFVGIDSAFAHFANALAVPFVALLAHYRYFKKYQPYSGPMDLNCVINYDGSVNDIPVDLVLKKFDILKEMNRH